MKPKTITGVLEDINKQITDLRKTHSVKVGKVKRSIKEVPGGKRILLTVALKLEEK